MSAIEDGMAAEQILNSTVFKRAMDSVEKAVMNSIKQTKIDGSPETDRYLIKLYSCLQVSEIVKGQIKAAMVSGKVEAERFQKKTTFRSGL